MKKTKRISKKKAAGFLALVILVILSARQIWRVNHSPLLEKYGAVRVIYEAGAEVELPDAMYYWDTADLAGYRMKVLSAELMDSNAFLSRYDMSLDKLKALASEEEEDEDDGGWYLDCEYVYLIDLEFYNEFWNEPSGDFVILDNFMLVGTDYYLMPDTQLIQYIPDFHPELSWSIFAIQTDRKFRVTLPYLIPTKGRGRFTLEEVLDPETRLLISTYPEESYLELPSPTIS